MQRKYKIEYNQHVYKHDVIYITAGFKFGIATKYFKIDDGLEYICSLAFANMFVNYFKKQSGIPCECNVGRSVTCFSIKSAKETMGQDLTGFLETLHSLEFTEADFGEIKEKTIENFRKVYKDGEFRAWYKAMEITEIVKGYTLKQLIKDLTELDYEHFREAYEYLVRNGECNVWVNGNIRDLTTEEACKIGEIMGQSSHQIRLCGKLIDPYLLDDCHIVEAARKPCNVDVIRFSFDKSVDMLDRYIWVNIETHKVPESNKEINIDAYDASLTAGVAELSSIKGLFENPVDKEQYEAARNSVMMKYFRWLEKEPFVFALKYMEMQMWGLSLPEFLRTMDALDYEGYLSSERAVRPIITEAQIAMRRNLNG